jgi:hypothetical protein
MYAIVWIQTVDVLSAWQADWLWRSSKGCVGMLLVIKLLLVLPPAGVLVALPMV